MVPRIGIASVVKAILVVVKSLIRLPLLKFYLHGRHTLLETAPKYGVSVSTLQPYLKNVPQSQDVSYRIPPIAITLQMDATYWGRNFGVVIFMDASSHRVLHYRFLRGKESICDYQAYLSPRSRIYNQNHCK